LQCSPEDGEWNDKEPKQSEINHRDIEGTEILLIEIGRGGIFKGPSIRNEKASPCASCLPADATYLTMPGILGVSVVRYLGIGTAESDRFQREPRVHSDKS